ncbi:ABC transporter permease [Paenibacillus sp. tmac-D7]|uniref:ABC transporter permease n=1 Tax=Paenibacillus sp. tmac-D7 TaxID=2591462 RepID=UPI0011433432|nr:ABC transporter permease [Paenibacillus sp. tmac-D7]
MALNEFFRKYGIFIVLALLFILFSSMTEAFLTINNLLNILRQVSMMGIVAVGMCFVMIAGGIDLSVGAQISLVSILTSWLMVHAEVHPVLAAVAGVAAATLVGFVNGYLWVTLNIHPLMITLATMTIVTGLSKMISGGMSIFGFDKSFRVLGQGYVGSIPIPVIILIVVALIGSFILNKTYFGRYVYALGGNEEAARLSGVNVKRMRMMLFSLGGFITGIAGIVLLSRMNSGQPNAGAGFEFDVLTAAILGGISIMGGEGKISGVLTGVLIIGVLSNGLVLMNVGDYYQSIIKGVVLIAAIGLDGLQHKNRKKKAAPSVQLAAGG